MGKYNEVVHQLFIDIKKAYDLLKREGLYSIFIEFGILLKLVMVIKMCLSETYNRVWAGKHLSDLFPKLGDALSPLLFNCSLEYASRRVQVNQDGLKLNGTHQFWIMLLMLM